MLIVDCPQGSEAWLRARCGRVTASNIADVLSRSRDRKSEGATRANYKARIIAEILSGQPQEDGYSNGYMEDGIENEPLGRCAYEVRTGQFVDQVGFVVHPRLERSGASPDGLVGDKGMVQIKCPKPAVHISYRLAGVVPAKYEPQMRWELACCEREWSDFVSYCPVFPAPLNLFVVRLFAHDGRATDHQEIDRITAEVTQFNREVDEIIEKLTGRPVDEYLERLNMKAACL
jgi:hypothetical protein